MYITYLKHSPATADAVCRLAYYYSFTANTHKKIYICNLLYSPVIFTLNILSPCKDKWRVGAQEAGKETEKDGEQAIELGEGRLVH